MLGYVGHPEHKKTRRWRGERDDNRRGKRSIDEDVCNEDRNSPNLRWAALLDDGPSFLSYDKGIPCRSAVKFYFILTEV
jgi:hypothetical protein